MGRGNKKRERETKKEREKALVNESKRQKSQ